MQAFCPLSVAYSGSLPPGPTGQLPHYSWLTKMLASTTVEVDLPLETIIYQLYIVVRHLGGNSAGTEHWIVSRTLTLKKETDRKYQSWEKPVRIILGTSAGRTQGGIGLCWIELSKLPSVELSWVGLEWVELNFELSLVQQAGRRRKEAEKDASPNAGHKPTKCSVIDHTREQTDSNSAGPSACSPPTCYASCNVLFMMLSAVTVPRCPQDLHLIIATGVPVECHTFQKS